MAGVPSRAVREYQLPALGVVERQMHQHHRVGIFSLCDRRFVDNEFDRGVSVAALRVVSIPHAHESVAEAARQFQGPGLRGRKALDDVGGGIHAFHVAMTGSCRQRSLANGPGGVGRHDAGVVLRFATMSAAISFWRRRGRAKRRVPYPDALPQTGWFCDSFAIQFTV